MPQSSFVRDRGEAKARGPIRTGKENVTEKTTALILTRKGGEAIAEASVGSSVGDMCPAAQKRDG